MYKYDLSKIIGKLSSLAKIELANATELAIAYNNKEVKVEHYLISLLDSKKADSKFLWDKTEIQTKMLRSLLVDIIESSSLITDEGAPIFSPILIGLFSDALNWGVIESNQSEIRTSVIMLQLFKNPHRYVSNRNLVNFLDVGDKVYRDILNNFETYCELSEENMQLIKSDSKVGNFTKDNKNSDGSAVSADSVGNITLAKYAENLTQKARDNRLDPVYCRDKETFSLIDILSQRRKNNPIIVGEPGVGKTALVELLAIKIASGLVPNSLKNVEIYSLDLGALKAGASVKGEFEKRIKLVIDEIKNSEIPIIMFIDEAHMLVGGDASSSEVANLLKPALARGELRTIAATTWSEYKKYFEKDAALSRRFQLVKVDPLSINDSIRVIRAIAPLYAKRHNLLVSDSAIENAVRYSARYMADLHLPDKAIDVLDTACARVGSILHSQPRIIEEKEAQLDIINKEISVLAKEVKISDSSIVLENLKEKERAKQELNAEIDELKAAWDLVKNEIKESLELQIKITEEELSEEELKECLDKLDSLKEHLRNMSNSKLKVNMMVTEADIAMVISNKTGVPADKMSADSLKRILVLKDDIAKNIIGQDYALNQICESLKNTQIGLRKESGAAGSFLLVGSSGIGKTETARQIANLLYGGDSHLTVINMSEYQEKHTVSRLIGSPPGYVGYGEGGVLTEAIRKKPYSVVLMDEVEKASPDVLNICYQLFDSGKIADGEGRIIDCRDTVFFLTSNLSSEIIIEHFEKNNEDSQENFEKAFSLVEPTLARFFKSALLARMNTVIFKPIQYEDIIKIIRLKIDNLKDQVIDKYKIKLSIDDSLISYISRKCNFINSGVRFITAIIEREIYPLIADIVIKSRVDNVPVYTISIGYDDDKSTIFHTLL